MQAGDEDRSDARAVAPLGCQLTTERPRSHRAAKPPRWRCYPRRRTRQQKCSRSDEHRWSAGRARLRRSRGPAGRPESERGGSTRIQDAAKIEISGGSAPRRGTRCEQARDACPRNEGCWNRSFLRAVRGPVSLAAASNWTRCPRYIGVRCGVVPANRANERCQCGVVLSTVVPPAPADCRGIEASGGRRYDRPVVPRTVGPEALQGLRCRVLRGSWISHNAPKIRGSPRNSVSWTTRQRPLFRNGRCHLEPGAARRTRRMLLRQALASATSTRIDVTLAVDVVPRDKPTWA